MNDSPFSNAAERIQFSQAVTYLENGSPQMIPADRVDAYVGMGLLRRDGDRLQLTDAGQREHDIAKGERFTDG